MRTLRMWLPWAIAAWLGCQAVAFVWTPVALAHAVASADEDSCCPGIAPGRVCPMHHSRSASRTCRLTNACGSSSIALVSLVGVIGIPETVSLPTPVGTSASTNSQVERTPRAPLSNPDSPPPRS